MSRVPSCQHPKQTLLPISSSNCPQLKTSTAPLTFPPAPGEMPCAAGGEKALVETSAPQEGPDAEGVGAAHALPPFAPLALQGPEERRIK